jgi:hypothetical protein
MLLGRLLWLWLIGVMGIGLLYLLFTDVMAPTRQETMAQTQIYAYRGWQSTGIRLEANESAEIRASGEWLYTPGEWHGADGHKRYPAPSYYPLPDVPGGVLLGRVGENGYAQWVGTRGNLWASEGGMLYLRINDDLLGDNQGSLEVSIKVIPAPEPYAD